ncbi:21902_t:CDS:2 [Cetraspora pellucida]|uniref:21902_t:CDS:1 n=1 Tax=Cetraspora pellucida TaxID=1433469 RepID=A0A9N8ZJV3_9GLOM|nr:21902_t:CDS:2 [Cetraspora pellucida]
MTSIFCAISFIKSVSGSNKCRIGSAIYRTAIDEFMEYKFKAFYSEESSLIKELTEKTIIMIIGRFAFEDKLNVTISQSVTLRIQTAQDEPNIYDLPIAPAFGIFSAPIQDPSEPYENKAIFRLKKDVYNSVNRKNTNLSVICKYDPRGHHSSVAEASKCRSIFSVAGELVFVEKSVFVLCDAIEWNYKTQENFESPSNKMEHLKNKRARDEELAKIAKIFNSKKKNRSNTHEDILRSETALNNIRAEENEKNSIIGTLSNNYNDSTQMNNNVTNESIHNTNTINKQDNLYVNIDCSQVTNNLDNQDVKHSITIIEIEDSDTS